MSKDRLQDAFQYVRKTFFPRWDKKGEWKVIHDGEFPILGQCQSWEKRIVVKIVSQKRDRLYCLLIHEICHAWGNGLHRTDWQKRMIHRQKKAYEIGLTDLSDLIEEDLKYYRSPSGKEEDCLVDMADAIRRADERQNKH